MSKSEKQIETNPKVYILMKHNKNISSECIAVFSEEAKKYIYGTADVLNENENKGYHYDIEVLMLNKLSF